MKLSDSLQEAFFRAMLNGDDFDEWGSRGGWVYGYVEVKESDLARLYDTYTDVVLSYGTPEPEELLGVWFAQIAPDTVISVSQCEDLEDAETWFDEEMSGVIR